MKAGSGGAGRGGGNTTTKKLVLDAPQETTRLLLDSVRIAHETERIGAQCVGGGRQWRGLT